MAVVVPSKEAKGRAQWGRKIRRAATCPSAAANDGSIFIPSASSSSSHGVPDGVRFGAPSGAG